MNSWIKNSIFYQIYPTSFYDSNNDGIGDLNGITEKVEYIKNLGVNAIWINPFYPSSFFDGGYDITDYYSIDKKFGTMADFENLVSVYKNNGIKVVIDLVIGHTSFKHKWFKKSALNSKNKYSDYYIWTDVSFCKYKDKTIHGLFPRDGGYYINYYACQPALNFGFNKIESQSEESAYSAGSSWKMRYDDDRLKPIRGEVINIMKFWLGKGVDGFRVDLANSLVKECVYNSDKDEDIEGNRWLWNILISEIKKDYPDCAFISEWVYAKNAVGKCGFDVDFYTHDIDSYNELFRNEKGSNLMSVFEKGHSFFADDGNGSIDNFIDYYLKDLSFINGKGYVSIPTGSHDQVRIAKYKSNEQMKVVFAFLLTLKHIPFIYYGDEIALTHNNKVNKDGGYIRTGARTPMQWTNGKNRGFSLANKNLYLPVNSHESQSVESQNKESASLLNTVKKLIQIRKKYSCLNADGDFEVVFKGERGYPLVFKRKDAEGSILVALNPSDKTYSIDRMGKIIYSNNIVEEKKLILRKNSFAIIEQK